MENSRWEFRSPVTKTTAGISAKIYLYHHSPKYIFISPKYIFISPKYIFISPKYIYITIHHHQQHNPKTPALCDEASIRLITNMQELHFPCFFLVKTKVFDAFELLVQCCVRPDLGYSLDLKWVCLVEKFISLTRRALQSFESSCSVGMVVVTVIVIPPLGLWDKKSIKTECHFDRFRLIHLFPKQG